MSATVVEASTRDDNGDIPMTTLAEEISAYEGMRRTLEIDHFGKWVVVYGGKLVGTYDSFEEAADHAVRSFGRGPYLIREVGAPPSTLPASVLYHPVADHAGR